MSRPPTISDFYYNETIYGCTMASFRGDYNITFYRLRKETPDTCPNHDPDPRS